MKPLIRGDSALWPLFAIVAVFSVFAVCDVVLITSKPLALIRRRR